MNSWEVELRRKKVASLLAQAATEEEIAQQLNVNQSPYLSRFTRILRPKRHRRKPFQALPYKGR